MTTSRVRLPLRDRDSARGVLDCSDGIGPQYSRRVHDSDHFGPTFCVHPFATIATMAGTNRRPPRYDDAQLEEVWTTPLLEEIRAS